MVKKTDKNQIREIEKLLNQQTIVILDAVDGKLQRTELRIRENGVRRIFKRFDFLFFGVVR